MQSEEEIMQAARLWRDKDRERRMHSDISAPSQSSAAEYKREVMRLRKGAHTPGQLWMRAAETTSVGTWKRRRAAIKHCIRELVHWTLARFEQSQRTGPDTTSDWSRHLERLAF